MGATPRALGPGASNSTANLSAPITINVPPGMDSKQVAQDVAAEFRRMLDLVNEEARLHVEGG